MRPSLVAGGLPRERMACFTPGEVTGLGGHDREAADARVEVDPDSCEANGVCAGLVPDVFELDDDDRLHILVTGVPPRLTDGVRHAVRSCPKAALRMAPLS